LVIHQVILSVVIRNPVFRERSGKNAVHHQPFKMMNTKMYVGNLSFDSTEQDLRELFSTHGEVTEVFMPMDRETSRPRGFAFVTMDSAEAMSAAIGAVNGQAFQGRPLTVNEAKPQQSNGGGGGFGGGGGGKRAGSFGSRGRY
jgi:cold-inducible RNA-binding protein